MDNLALEFEKIKNYDFDFENLAFEGGGVKMGSYIGVVKTLEIMGVLQKCKRFAGTSSGAIFAMLLAANASADEVHRYMLSENALELVSDSLGAVSLIPNILRKFGWNPANRFLNSLRKELELLTGHPDITFLQLYKKFGKTLCIVATNVSTMSIEYFHPKTTPNFPVALAVRASGGLPGFIQPVCAETEMGMKQYFTDGGLVSNFPLHVFDGWYLSMDPQDSFFNKIGQRNEFGSFNPHTLGFIVYATCEGEFMQGELHSRYKQTKVLRPKTRLARERGKKCDAMLEQNLNRQKLMDASQRFLLLLREMDVNKDFEISLDEFKNAFHKLDVNKDDVTLLFGENFNFARAFLEMDHDHNGKISFDEFVMFLETKGINFRAVLAGGNMTQIKSCGKFFSTTFNTILNINRKTFFKEDDMARTAGVYTDYIDTADFQLTNPDKKFLMNQGIKACLAYFQYLVTMHEDGRLPASMSNCVTRKNPTPEKNALQSIDLEKFCVGVDEMNTQLSDEKVQNKNSTCSIWAGFLTALAAFFVLAAFLIYFLLFHNN